MQAFLPRVLVLLIAACSPGAAWGEPSIIAPQSVPAGGMFIVRLEGIDKDAKFNWHVPGGGVILADLLDRNTLSPVLFGQLEATRTGTLSLVLAYIEGGEVKQKSAQVVIGGPAPTPVPPGPVPTPEPTTRATAATYVYEKDQHAIPNPVLAALNKLNRERGILATVLEADTTDGTGQVPDQYRAALEAAKRDGLPCLVVSGESGVIRIVKNPTTEAAVMEAVP